MARHLQILGLALVAALALSAFAASAASAEPFVLTSEVENTTLKGEQVGTTTIGGDGGKIKCEGGKLTGSMSNPAGAAVEVTLTPTYEKCTFAGLAGVEVQTNSCGYVLKTGEKEGSNYEAQLGVNCEKETDSITFTAKLSGVTKCIVHIGEQAGLGKVTISEEGSPTWLRAKINLTSVEYDQTAGTGLGACTKAENTTNGTYEGESTIKGYSGETQKKLIALPLTQTVDIKTNPVKVKGNGTTATFDIENLLNQQVQILAMIGPPGGAIKPMEKCKTIAKMGDTCNEEVECVKARGKDAVLGLVTSPVGGAMVKLEGC
jgi:hypothetical protein